MDENMKKLLQGRFRKGSLSKTDQNQLTRLIASGKLDLYDFDDLKSLDNLLAKGMRIEPSSSMDAKFYAMLERESNRGTRQNKIMLPLWVIGVAAGLLIMLGFLVGMLWHTGPDYGQDKIESQESQVIQMLSNEMHSERLGAVLTAAQMDNISVRLTEALLFTLNFDNNDNVRMASIEALMPYTDQPKVRQGMVKALRNQESPIVILTLSEALLTIGEKSVVQNLRQEIEKNVPSQVINDLVSDIKLLY